MRHPFVQSCALAAALVLFTSAAAAQRASGDSASRQSRELPLTVTKPLRFTTDEGTWLSLDVSPDGRTIVFDLLGDVYSLPIAGGRATRITSGQAMDAQPNFSPDGKAIVFVSDRNGTDNLWTMNPDGTGARAHARGRPRLHLADVDP